MRIPAPPYIETIKPYIPGKPIEEVERELGLTHTVKMASNENPLGPSPRAIEALKGFLDKIHIYPDGAGFYLCRALGARYGVDPARIILGNGSVEIVEMSARAYLCPGVNAVFSQGAFAMYPIACQIVNAEARQAPMRDRTHDLHAMLDLMDEKTRLVIVANPNNPTGTYNALRDVERFLERVPETALVVMDEAYKEFVDAPDYGSALPLLDRFPNLLVLGTFSKAYGLAALRVGYGFAQPEVITTLHKVRSPFNTSAPAQVAALAALDDEAFVQTYLAINRVELAYLTGELKAMGLQVTPSVTNFLMVDVPMDADECFRALLREGVIVRPQKSGGFPRSLRVTVHTREGNDRFLAATKKVLGR